MLFVLRYICKQSNAVNIHCVSVDWDDDSVMLFRRSQIKRFTRCNNFSRNSISKLTFLLISFSGWFLVMKPLMNLQYESIPFSSLQYIREWIVYNKYYCFKSFLFSILAIDITVVHFMLLGMCLIYNLPLYTTAQIGYCEQYLVDVFFLSVKYSICNTMMVHKF